MLGQLPGQEKEHMRREVIIAVQGVCGGQGGAIVATAGAGAGAGEVGNGEGG